MTTELLAIGSPGSALRVALSPVATERPLAAIEERAFEVVYEVDADPFAGNLRDALFAV